MDVLLAIAKTKMARSTQFVQGQMNTGHSIEFATNFVAVAVCSCVYNSIYSLDRVYNYKYTLGLIYLFIIILYKIEILL